MLTKKFTRSSALAGLTALTVSLGVTSAAEAGNPGPKYGTCLHRTVDGFNGCWASEETPGQNGLYKFPSVNCTHFNVTYLGNTPQYNYGVGRTNALASEMRRDNGLFSGISGWVGLGDTALNSFGYEGTAGRIRVYLGAPNTYANVQVQVWGPGACQWLPA